MPSASAQNRDQKIFDQHEEGDEAIGRPRLYLPDPRSGAQRPQPRLPNAPPGGAVPRRNIPQLDGAADEIFRSGAQNGDREQSSAPIVQLDGTGDSEEGEANDDLNSDLDEADDDNEETAADHIVLCQYEKVSRTKNKWRCVLRDGVMHLNGRDYLFHKATGEFEW